MHSNLKPLALLFVLSIICSGLVNGQNKQDSLEKELAKSNTAEEEAEILLDLVKVTAFSKPDTGLIYAKRAFELAKNIDDQKVLSRAYSELGKTYYTNANWDELKSHLLAYIIHLKKNQEFNKIAGVYRNLSIVGEQKRTPDSSLVYIQKCIETLETYPDSLVLLDAYISKGLIFRHKGFFELSLESLLEAVKIGEDLEREDKLAYAHLNLGITYDFMDKQKEGTEAHLRSIDYFKKANNLIGAARALNNLGQSQRELKNVTEAIVAHEESIEISSKTKNIKVELSNHFNLVKIYFRERNFSKCKFHIEKSELLSQKTDYEFIKGALLRYKARIAIEENKIETARIVAKEATKYKNAYSITSEHVEVDNELSIIQEKLGNYQEALYHYKAAQEVSDILYNEKKVKQFEEINVIYQTEKKDAKISLLNKEAELNEIRKKGLWRGILLLLLTGASVIFSLITKSRKKQALLSKEKELADEKRIQAERELEFKKKELTAKVLQLASKNEFLQTLEKEVGNLKSSIDERVGQTSQKISRMINNDALDDQEWDLFQQEFASIHQHFIDKLSKQYGDFSNHEWRLISLLKMNLSSKEIANILRISPDGVKKARYRLRKKINLESDLDIQDYQIQYA